jgi:hypothetical protein
VLEVVVLKHSVKPKEDFLQKVFFFNLEPKPAKCFSILGYKTIQGQKTFNVECEKEEDCIKYVDYITMIIQNYKNNKEEIKSDNI